MIDDQGGHMRKTAVYLLVVVLSLGLATPRPAHGQELSPDARQGVDYLLKDWQRQFSSTSIPHAMEYIGLEADDALRLELIEHLRANDSLARNLQWWGANNYLFSNLEKRLAKYLILRQGKAERAPALTEVAVLFELAEAELNARLDFMVSAGFLQEADSPLGVALAPGFRRWAGPLQHNFHTLRIEGEAPLDVW